MADRGFMIQEMLDKLNIKLNVPPFLDERQQFEAMHGNCERQEDCITEDPF